MTLVRRAMVLALVLMGSAATLSGCDGAPISPALGGIGGAENQAGGSAGSSGALAGAGSFGPLDCSRECTDCAARNSADLFGSSAVPTFELTLPPERWENLQANALAEEYTEACLTFDGTPIGSVGLRFKGSYGTLVPCVSANGDITCTKLSMKLKFNQIDTDQRFYGLKRLNLHSLIHDPSKLKERLAYDLYRDMGIPSPRSAWATVLVNGESYGVYSLVEQIDGRFTEAQWPNDGGGNLYKEAWPQSSDVNYFGEHLKTNGQTAVHDRFAQFSTQLQAAAPEERADVLGLWTDLEQWYRYLAVDDAIFNCDGITAFYTEGLPFRMNHNYYVYQETAQDRFTLIPWDLDSTFTPWGSWSAVPRWTQLPDDCDQLYAVWNGDSTVMAPGCDAVFQALASDLTGYRDAIDELLMGPFDEAAVLDKIDLLAARIADAVQADPLELGTSGWRSAIDSLKQMIPILRRRLERLRDDQPVEPLGLSATTVNDFEAADDFGLLIGSQTWLGPNVTASRSINTTAPLAGAQDLRLDFEYRDGIDPWSQWLELLVPLTAIPVDVSSMTGIRFWVSADQNRNLRLNLDSPAQSASNQGIRFGWDVAVGPTPELVEVLFADAAVQTWAIAEGRDPGDPLSAVLSSVTALLFQPECVGRGASGFLPEGTADVGTLSVDDLEFFTE